MLERLDDTIVAISSAPGHGRVGIVRLGGPDALSIADQMARPATGAPFSRRPGSTRTLGEVFIDHELSLPADVYIFRAPRSYTRQHIVELHTIGSPAALELVRVRAIELGASPAEPGEFTARAFVHGAMDLAEAEAVAGIISARSDTQLRAARLVMEGELSRQVADAKAALAELLALVEADIDFAEEPIDFITPAALRGRLKELAASLEPLLWAAVSKQGMDTLPRILLFGPPNAGKSSLMNRLSGTNRAICAAAAGTTRDILSAPIRVGRGEAILLDTAGIDRSRDELVAAARASAMSAARRVDLVCVVLDVSQPDDGHLLESFRSLEVRRCVLAANKADLVGASELRGAIGRLERWNMGAVCSVSALRGTGIDRLRDAFADRLGATIATTAGEAVALNARQGNAIRSATQAMKRAATLSEGIDETIDCAELLAFELREALDDLSVLTGEVSTNDLLRRVFANFCIGK